MVDNFIFKLLLLPFSIAILNVSIHDLCLLISMHDYYSLWKPAVFLFYGIACLYAGLEIIPWLRSKK